MHTSIYLSRIEKYTETFRLIIAQCIPLLRCYNFILSNILYEVIKIDGTIIKFTQHE